MEDAGKGQGEVVPKRGSFEMSRGSFLQLFIEKLMQFDSSGGSYQVHFLSVLFGQSQHLKLKWHLAGHCNKLKQASINMHTDMHAYRCMSAHVLCAH